MNASQSVVVGPLDEFGGTLIFFHKQAQAPLSLELSLEQFWIEVPRTVSSFNSFRLCI